MSDLRKAAEAVLERWDSPAWEWIKRGPTAELMAALRAALDAPSEDIEALRRDAELGRWIREETPPIEEIAARVDAMEDKT